MGLTLNSTQWNQLVMEHNQLVNIIHKFNKKFGVDPLPLPTLNEFLLHNYRITKMIAEDGMWSSKYELEFETDSDMVAFKLARFSA